MYTITKRQLMLLTLGGFLSYLLFGIFDSMRGATLSTLLSDLHFNYASGGTIVMGQYAGYFTATLLVGVLADRIGPKLTLILAGISLVFGVVGYSISSKTLSLIAFIFFIGIGLGSLELGGCNIITALYQEKKGRYLNILAAIAGCGAFATPMIAGLLLDQGMSWRVIYRIGLIIAVPVTFYFILLKLPLALRSAGSTHKGTVPSEKRTHIPSQFGIWIMNVSNFAYMAAEIGTASWLVDFYQDIKHFSVIESSSSLSLFYIGITAGRFAGSLFVDRLGHIPSVLFASVGAAFCILAGVFGPDQLAILASITGFFYSIIFPTSTAIVSGLSSSHSGRTLGIFLAFGGLGGMFGPWIVGIASDLIGLEYGMAMNSIFCGAIFLSIFFVKKWNTSLILLGKPQKSR